MKRKAWADALKLIAKDISLSAAVIMFNNQKQAEQTVPVEITRYIQALQKIQRSINASRLNE